MFKKREVSKAVLDRMAEDIAVVCSNDQKQKRTDVALFCAQCFYLTLLQLPPTAALHPCSSLCA